MNNTNSTYSLLVRSRSEDKNRSALEVVVFTLFILSAVFSIWQFAQQRVAVPAAGLTPCVACAPTVETTGI
jgi:uncharacterized membrane protein YqjE